MSKPSIRCSSLDSLLSCPGSRTLIAALGCVREDASDSWEGQWCHHEAATRLVNLHDAIPPEAGLPKPDIPEGYIPAGHARWVVDYYLNRVLEDAGGEMAVEVEAELSWEFDGFFLTGHCDFYAVNSDCTELLFDDLKAGINLVDAAEMNWQVMGYAALFKLQWPSLKKIRGRIIQPRLSEDVGPRETELVLEGEQLERAAEFLESSIKQALDNPMLLQTGIKACRWCDAALRCPALAAERDLMKMTITKEKIEEIKLAQDDQALAAWCVAGKLLGPKFDAAKDLLKERLAGGKEIVIDDGEAAGTRLFLAEKPGVRNVTDKTEAWHRMAGHWQQDENSNLEFVPGLLEEGEALECVTIRIGELEKVVAAKFSLPLDSKKNECGKSKTAELLEGLVERQPQQWLMIV